MSESSSSSESVWSKPITIFSGVLLAVIVVAAVVVAVVSGNKAEPIPEETPVAETPYMGNSDTESSCGLSDADQSIPTTAAPDTNWQLVGTIAAPTSESAGPGLNSDGLRSCFAHSPEGALFAAANIAVQGSDPDLAVQSVEVFVAPGLGREKAIEITRDAVADGAIGSPDQRVQIAGFQVLEYEGDTATIDLAVRGSNGAVASVVTQLTWLDGDWKVVLQENGQPAVPLRGLDSLSGYLLWSGA